MTRKQKITLSITGIILVTLILVGLTYGYYLTTIKGNTNTKSITTSLANLELKYDDGNGIITSSNLEPGDSVTKTFSVENTGNKKVVNYTVYLENVINEFIDKNDLKITLKCTSNIGTCNGNTLTYPSSDGIIAVNDIEEKEIQTFELKVDFIETNDLQNDNMNKKFEGNVKILDIKSTNKKLVTSEGENNATVSSPELLTNFKIYGNSLQETRSGKNLINIPDFNVSYTNTYYINTATNFKLEAGKTYTLSFDYNIKSATSTVAVAVGYGTTTYSKDIQAKKDYDTQTTGRQSVTFTTPSAYTTDDYLFVRFARVSTPSTVNVDLSNIQLEEGTTATDYEAYGVSPSPTYPSEISSVGDLVTNTNDSNYGKYKLTVKTTGKNLIHYPYAQTTKTQNGITFTDNMDGSITIDGTATENTTFYLYSNVTSLLNNIKNGDTITLSMTSDKTLTNNTRLVANYYDSSKTMKYGLEIYGSTLSKTQEITSDWKGMVIYIVILSGETVDKVTIKPQLELGDNSSTYEKYEETLTNIYLDEPLRKVGNYSDYVDLINKKVVRNTTKKVFNGTENWNSFNSTKVFFITDSSLKYENDIYCLTDKYLCQVSAGGQSYKSGNAWVQSTSKYPRIYFADDNYSTATTFKNNLKTNNITGIYVLNETKTEDLNISEIELSENTKKIFIETNTKPSNIEIEYIN